MRDRCAAFSANLDDPFVADGLRLHPDEASATAGFRVAEVPVAGRLEPEKSIEDLRRHEALPRLSFVGVGDLA